MSILDLLKAVPPGQSITLDPTQLDNLIDDLLELDAWRSLDMDTPEECQASFERLEEAAWQCNDKGHQYFDDYKSFFEDCVESLNAHWPYAEPWDNNLRSVICDAIASGDTDSEE